MVSKINNSNGLEYLLLKEKIKDLEVEIIVKERKMEELKKSPWYVVLVSWIIGITSAFLLLFPAGIAGYQQNWVPCIVFLFLFVVIIVAYGAFLNYGTKQGKHFRKLIQEINLAKKKKKNS